MKKILLVGASLNSGNRGVNALTRSQIMLILDKIGLDVEITILSYSINNVINNEIDYNGNKVIVKEVLCKKNDMIKAYLGVDNHIKNYIKNSDAILDISEGDSFSDIYGMKRFIQHSLIKLTAIKEKKKLIIMPQTLGPFKSKVAQNIAKYILNKATKVFVRDEISKNVAINDLNVKREIIFKPDMAFYMKPDTKINVDKFIDKNKTTIGINVSSLLYNGGYNKGNMFNLKTDYKKLINNLIITLSKIENSEIILIPHVMLEEVEVEDDFRVCKKIAEEFKLKNNLEIKTLDKYYREDELKAIISKCDYFIGSRMHACIGAISTKVPTTPIAYSRKFKGIWKKIELEYCITDPREQSEEEIISTIMKNFENRDVIKAKLEEQIPLFIEQIGTLIKEMGI